MDEVRINYRVGIPSIGLQSVRLPIIGNRIEQSGDAMLKDLKSHMLGWYDVKRQGCTNDSLAENPVLKNLSNRKVYSYDFNDLILSAGVTKAGDYKALIPAQSLSSSRNIIAKDVNVGDSFPAYSVKISGLQEGNIIELPTGSGLARKDGVYNIVKHTYTEDEDLRYRYVLRSGDYNDLTIEILPLTLDLQLHNFEFGGLSGIGSYLNTITGLSNNDRFEGTFTKHSVTITRIIQTDIPNYINIDTAKSKIIKFNVTGLPTDGFVVFHRDAAGNYETKFSNGEHEVTINPNYSLTAVGITGIPVNTETNIKFEILPSFPNSLVFNGVAPTWYINKSNYKLNGNVLKGTWLSNTIINITGDISNYNNYIYLDNALNNTDEDILEVKIPSYKIRVSGLSDGQTISIYNNKRYDNISHFSERIVNATNGTYILSEVNTTIERTNSDYDISYSDFRLIVNKKNEAVSDNVDITIEFLPNYAAPTTKMYGIIPSLTQGAKCMMMDVTPLNYDGINVLYSQDSVNPSSDAISINYIIMKNNLSLMAYGERNRNGTYINGIRNKNITVLDLVNTRQVISVNTNNIFDTDISVGAYYNRHYGAIGSAAVMALNSLILFDRELTTEEMAYVIEKLMGGGKLLSHQEYEMNMADTDPFTLYLDFQYQLPEDVTAYTGEIVGDSLKIHAIQGNIIPANTGVLVKTTTPGIKTFKEVYKTPSEMPANDLHGVTVNTPLTDLAGTNEQVLTLGVVDGVIGIRKPALSYIKANRCYGLVKSYTPDDKNPETSGYAD